MKAETNINKNSVFDILGVEPEEWFIIANEIDYILPSVQTSIAEEDGKIMVFFRPTHAFFGEEEELSYHRRPKGVIKEIISDVRKGKSKIIKFCMSWSEMRSLKEEYARKAAEKRLKEMKKEGANDERETERERVKR